LVVQRLLTILKRHPPGATISKPLRSQTSMSIYRNLSRAHSTSLIITF
jgi:hypothetical protein